MYDYFTDKSTLFAKIAHQLTAKACWPSIFERQNVKLALKIFSESTSAGLKIPINSRIDNIKTQSAEFISIIVDIWKIFNVSTPQKGIRLKDEFYNPLVNADPRFLFLERVVFWLEAWEANSKSNKSSLSRQTFTSLKHTCQALPHIVNHLTNNCGFSYVLTSFLQNDPLEHHFGLYRQMSGANYHISYCQVLESERRLKLSSILKLYQTSAEQISVRDFIRKFSNCPDNELVSSTVSSEAIEELLNQLPELETIMYDSQTLQALVFMAGYTVHKFYMRSKKCSTCLNFFTID